MSEFLTIDEVADRDRFNWRSRAFQSGLRAALKERLHGVERVLNPHRPHTPSRDAWAFGYSEGMMRTCLRKGCDEYCFVLTHGSEIDISPVQPVGG